MLGVIDAGSDLKESLQGVHDLGGIGAQFRAVDDVKLTGSILHEPALQVVAVLARV